MRCIPFANDAPPIHNVAFFRTKCGHGSSCLNENGVYVSGNVTAALFM